MPRCMAPRHHSEGLTPDTDKRDRVIQEQHSVKDLTLWFEREARDLGWPLP